MTTGRETLQSKKCLSWHSNVLLLKIAVLFSFLLDNQDSIPGEKNLFLSHATSFCTY